MTARLTCAERDLCAASDDPRERALAAEHDRGCAACAALAAADARLAALANAWRQASPAPPATLYARVRATPGRRSRPAAARRAPRRPLGWMAAAASLLLAAVLIVAAARGGRVPEIGERGGILVSDALRDAEQAEQAHARAIARLAASAAPILARAGDPQLPGRDAALLLAYRDRLAALDRTIGDIGQYVTQNPGNAAARSVLLTAYREKTRLLQQVLDLPERNG